MQKVLTATFWIIVALLGIPVFVVLLQIVFASFTGNGRNHSELTTVQDIAAMPAAGLSSDGELAAMFSFPSSATDIQREEKLRQIKGTVVEWRLPVFDVYSDSNGYYVIQTRSTSGQVGTFCHVKPEDDQ